MKMKLPLKSCEKRENESKSPNVDERGGGDGKSVQMGGMNLTKKKKRKILKDSRKIYITTVVCVSYREVQTSRRRTHISQ